MRLVANIVVGCVLLIAVVIWIINAPREGGSSDTITSDDPPSISQSPTVADLPVMDDNHVALPGIDEGFINLVFDYEEIHMSPDSPEKMERLATLATPRYIQDHLLPADVMSAESDVIVGVNRDLQKTLVIPIQNEDDTVRTMTVTPEITTTRLDDAGNKVVIYESIRMTNNHTTIWVKVNDTWKVDQEK